MNWIHSKRKLGTIVLATTIVLDGCASMNQDRDNSAGIERVDIPKELVIQQDQAIAYRIGGQPGKVVKGAKFSIKPLLTHSKKTPISFEIYAQQGEHYHLIAHQRQGSNLVADAVANKTYIVTSAQTGHIRVSSAALCRLTLSHKRPPREIPRICTQILCAAQPFQAEALIEEFGPLPNGLSPSQMLGGWGPIPGELCKICSQPAYGPGDKPKLSYICPGPAPSACSDGQVLFHADFETDTVGSIPNPSPAGPPPGDSIVSNGNVSVVNAATKAVRVQRSFSGLPANPDESSLVGVLDTGASSSGSYCIRFTGNSGNNMHYPAWTTFNSINGAAAWILQIDDDHVELVSGSGRTEFPGDFSVPHEFRFQVDLDLQRFDFYIDDVRVATNRTILDTSFDTPSEIRFGTGSCILECFPVSLTIDELQVTRTN